MNRNYEDIYYFQFKDIFKLVDIDSTTHSIGYYDIENPLNVLSSEYANKLTCFYGNSLIYCEFLPLNFEINPANIDSESVIVRNLLGKFILPRMWEKYVVRSKQESTPFRENYQDLEGVANKDVERFFFESEAFINETLPYYKKLIDSYSALEDNLINQLGSHNVVKFNDMPQTTSVATDDHLTNITDSKSEEDYLTNMTRLAEIQNNFKRIYSDWANEYERRFAIYLED